MSEKDTAYTIVTDVSQLEQGDVLTDTIAVNQVVVEGIGVEKVHFRDGTEATHGYVVNAMVKVGQKDIEGS